ncbi:putative reverse transcriptase domain-containing protein, partial [Tanacetum coccineum]
MTCFGCGAQGHYKSECPKSRNHNGNNLNNRGGAHRRAFVLGGGKAAQNPKVITGMFLLNNHYASVLFDTGADRSFVSNVFSTLLNIILTALDVKYNIELANGKLIGADTIIRVSNVIVGMDWLSKHRIVIVCDEKLVRVPFGNETLTIQGDKGDVLQGSSVYSKIDLRETTKVLTQAWDKLFEVKHAQSEEIQELLSKLVQDLQSINEELAEYINTPSWNLPTSSYDDDDDEYSFATQEYLMTCSTAITPDSPKMDSLIMMDKHLDTTLKTESDEFIKSSVENLVQNPRKSEDECECDVPDCDDSQMKNFSTFSNPLFDDSTSSDDESSHKEVIHEMSFKTYSNPLFDLDDEISSSEFNPIHNEDLDSTPKNDRFDTESYLLESLLNRDTLMASSPKIDSL